jgi:hypothetical protein
LNAGPGPHPNIEQGILNIEVKRAGAARSAVSDFSDWSASGETENRKILSKKTKKTRETQ